jgi:hypothetical protein
VWRHGHLLPVAQVLAGMDEPDSAGAIVRNNNVYRVPGRAQEPKSMAFPSSARSARVLSSLF